MMALFIDRALRTQQPPHQHPEEHHFMLWCCISFVSSFHCSFNFAFGLCKLIFIASFSLLQFKSQFYDLSHVTIHWSIESSFFFYSPRSHQKLVTQSPYSLIEYKIFATLHPLVKCWKFLSLHLNYFLINQLIYFMIQLQRFWDFPFLPP